MITYELNGSLYLNITNRCSNKCCFCIRNTEMGLGQEYDLWLEKEPSVEEIIDELSGKNLDSYKEIVFCGYGEPLERAEDVVAICRFLKANTRTPVRLNTNGQANIINKKDIAGMLEGCIDSVSISLNYHNAEEYEKNCSPEFGEEAFYAVLEFTRQCKKYVPDVIMTVVDVIGEEKIEKCREIAENLGVRFRIRKAI